MLSSPIDTQLSTKKAKADKQRGSQKAQPAPRAPFHPSHCSPLKYLAFPTAAMALRAGCLRSSTRAVGSAGGCAEEPVAQRDPGGKCLGGSVSLPQTHMGWESSTGLRWSRANPTAAGKVLCELQKGKRRMNEL